MIKYTVNFVFIAGLTNFDNVAIDGTFAKSANNKFNVIHKDDTQLLIQHYSGFQFSDDELGGLRYPAKKFKNRTDMTDENKLKHLMKILKRFDKTGANTIPINDIDSIHMVNKSGNPDVGYNIQTAVDNESKMFMAVMVTQKATDHNLFPDLITKAIENMGQRPGVSCADAAYNTGITLEFINENALNALIYNKRDVKLRNGHGSKDKFHKDKMDFDFDEDCFICFNNEKLHHQRTNTHWDDKKADYIIERLYFNENACANCEFKNECCKKAKFRTIKISG